jgi:hypothetical protein
MWRTTAVAAFTFAVLCWPSVAADPESLELAIVGKKSLDWPYPESQKDFETLLADQRAREKAGEKRVFWPAPPDIDLDLCITNTGKDKVSVYLGDGPSQLTLTLKGPGVTTANPGYSTAAELRQTHEVVLKPGKFLRIPLKRLADEVGGSQRLIYPTAPGEYTLSATYQLLTADGRKGPLLKSDEIKLQIKEKK